MRPPERMQNVKASSQSSVDETGLSPIWARYNAAANISVMPAGRTASPKYCPLISIWESLPGPTINQRQRAPMNIVTTANDQL